jgi:hypothetical protein
MTDCTIAVIAHTSSANAVRTILVTAKISSDRPKVEPSILSLVKENRQNKTSKIMMHISWVMNFIWVSLESKILFLKIVNMK